MKRLSAVFAVVFLIAVVALPMFVCADTGKSHVVDNVGVLTSGEIERLENSIDSLIEDYDTGYVILIDDTGGSYPSTYATNFLRNGGYKENNGGVILFLCLEPGNGCCQMEVEGSCYEKITNETVKSILDEIKSDVKDGNYYDAFSDHIELTEKALAGKYRIPLPTKSILIILGVGVVAGLIAGIAHISCCMKGMRVVAPVGAREYLVNGSFVLRNKDVRYLYTTVTKTARPKSDKSSGGGSSGGHSSGGFRF